jgi:hypothetical protein
MNKYTIDKFTIMVVWKGGDPFVVTGITESNAPYQFRLLKENRDSLNKWVEEISQKSPYEYEFTDDVSKNVSFITNSNATKPYKLKRWSIKNSILGTEKTDNSWYEFNVEFFLKVKSGNFASFTIELEWENGLKIEIDMNSFSPIVPQIIKAIGSPKINETIKRFFDLIAPTENKKDYQFFDGNTGVQLPSQKTLEKWERENPQKLAKLQEKLDAASISTPKKKGRPKKQQTTSTTQKPVGKKKISEVKSVDDIVELDLDDIEI